MVFERLHQQQKQNTMIDSDSKCDTIKSSCVCLYLALKKMMSIVEEVLPKRKMQKNDLFHEYVLEENRLLHISKCCSV